MARLNPDEIEDWLELTRDADPKVRSRAVRTLCPCHVQALDERIWERFFEMANDEDRGVRGSIFHALGDGSPRVLEGRVVSTLEEMQQDPDPKLRRQARKLLAQYRRTGHINVL